MIHWTRMLAYFCPHALSFIRFSHSPLHLSPLKVPLEIQKLIKRIKPLFKRHWITTHNNRISIRRDITRQIYANLAWWWQFVLILHNSRITGTHPERLKRLRRVKSSSWKWRGKVWKCTRFLEMTHVWLYLIMGCSYKVEADGPIKACVDWGSGELSVGVDVVLNGRMTVLLEM